MTTHDDRMTTNQFFEENLSIEVRIIKKDINKENDLVELNLNNNNEGRKVSIYVLGDDIRSISLEKDITEIQRLNTNQFNGAKKARIHAMAFPSEYQSEVIRFSHFMRQISKYNEGTFLGLSSRGHPGYIDLPAGSVIPTDD